MHYTHKDPHYTKQDTVESQCSSLTGADGVMKAGSSAVGFDDLQNLGIFLKSCSACEKRERLRNSGKEEIKRQTDQKAKKQK